MKEIIEKRKENSGDFPEKIIIHRFDLKPAAEYNEPSSTLKIEKEPSGVF